MKEIVVISGKGGTGKTSMTASFAVLGGKDIVVADCDVDAADMHLLMQPTHETEEDFYSGKLAIIDKNKCDQCGLCQEKCRFDAIHQINKEYTINPIDCEGCGYCAHICPAEAIDMVEQNIGQCFVSKTKVNNKLVHARLGIGAENSGKLVAKVKNEAKALATKFALHYVVVDGSPGVGCPVVSSLSGAHFVVLVTEPTASGIHDLKRVYELVKKFNIKAGCIINKADININKTEEILHYLEEEKIEHINSIPYNENFTKAMTNGKTIIEYDPKNLGKTLEQSWEKIKKLVNK